MMFTLAILRFLFTPHPATPDLIHHNIVLGIAGIAVGVRALVLVRKVRAHWGTFGGVILALLSGTGHLPRWVGARYMDMDVFDQTYLMRHGKERALSETRDAARTLSSINRPHCRVGDFIEAIDAQRP